MLDASVIVDALLGGSSVTEFDDVVAVPHLVDVEVLHALCRLAHAKTLGQVRAGRAVNDFTSLILNRYPMNDLHHRVWSLRANISAYDAAYVALAELLDVELVTMDARLANAPGPRCPIRVLRPAT